MVDVVIGKRKVTKTIAGYRKKRVDKYIDERESTILVSEDKQLLINHTMHKQY
jgi:hypothetical protein